MISRRGERHDMIQWKAHDSSCIAAARVEIVIIPAVTIRRSGSRTGSVISAGVDTRLRQRRDDNDFVVDAAARGCGARRHDRHQRG